MKSEVKSSLLNFLRILLLLAVCLGIAFLIVWPLWKLSTSFSKIYTIIVLVIMAAGLIWMLISKIRKTEPVKILQFFVNFIVILAAIILSVYFVLSLHRLFALITIIAATGLEILFNTIFAKKSRS